MIKKTTYLFYLIILLVVFNQTSYSQEVTEGIYNNENIKYYKNKIILSYKSDSVNNSSYIDRANEFIAEHNGSIDSVYSSGRFSVIDVTLIAPNADAINYMNIFKNSNLFEFVSFNGVIEQDGIDFEYYDNEQNRIRNK